MCLLCVCVANGQRVVSVFTERACLVNVGVSSVCVGGGARRSEVGRSVGGRRSAGGAPKVRTPHNDVGKKKKRAWGSFSGTLLPSLSSPRFLPGTYYT